MATAVKPPSMSCRSRRDRALGTGVALAAILVLAGIAAAQTPADPPKPANDPPAATPAPVPPPVLPPPARDRGMAIALWAMVILIAPISGPIMGGWITDNLSWPWLFYINLPVGAFAAAAAWSLHMRAHPSRAFAENRMHMAEMLERLKHVGVKRTHRLQPVELQPMALDQERTV